MPRKARNPSPPSSTASSQTSEDLSNTSPPTSIDPYETLSVPQRATAQEITKAYRLCALKHHPDKAPADLKDEYTKKFQEVAFAYAVLSDPARRRRYDATGNTSESLDLEDDEFNWAAYFKEKYDEVVSADAIEKVKKDYQGSEEERQDILNSYVAGKGDVEYIFENVMCSSILDDEDRFRTIIDSAIETGEVRPFKKYTSETKTNRDSRRKRAQGEAKEAEELAEELGVKEKLFGKGAKKSKSGSSKNGGGGEDALMALIQQRQKGRQEDLFSRLEAKYGGGGSGGGSKKKSKSKKRASPVDHDDDDDDEEKGADDTEPSEAAFAEMQRRMEQNREKKRSGGATTTTTKNNSKNKNKKQKTG